MAKMGRNFGFHTLQLKSPFQFAVAHLIWYYTAAASNPHFFYFRRSEYRKSRSCSFPSPTISIPVSISTTTHGEQDCLPQTTQELSLTFEQPKTSRRGWRTSISIARSLAVFINYALIGISIGCNLAPLYSASAIPRISPRTRTEASTTSAGQSILQIWLKLLHPQDVARAGTRTGKDNHRAGLPKDPHSR